MGSGEFGRGFTARDVRQVADISYRQLNDWGSKGVGEGEGDRGGKWRRFSARDVFALVVCSEFRRSLGVPLERLGFVYRCMTDEGADHFRATMEKMALLGVAVWIATDFQETFTLESELEFEEFFAAGWLAVREAPLALLRVDPLVNRMLALLEDPIQLPDPKRGRELREALAGFGVRNAAEFELLQLVRNGQYTSVEAVLDDGTIQTFRTTKKGRGRIEDLLQEHAYQTLTFTLKDGEVVSIKQVATEKPS